MTWSLHVRNGDLNFDGPGGLAVVTGQQKLIQDLKHWMLEPKGTDPMHPDYGSDLDTMTGTVFDQDKLLDVETEIRRILYEYQNQQVARIQSERMAFGGQTTLTLGEVLASVEDITAQQFQDTALVSVKISTPSGDSIAFSQVA